MESDAVNVSLKALMWYIITKSKIILVWSVVIGCLFGAVQFEKYTSIKNDEKKMAKFGTKNFLELKEYLLEKTTLEDTILVAQNKISQNKRYIEDSLYLKMNPLNMIETVVEIYVDSKYQIMPDKNIQPPDQIAKLLKVYSTLIANGMLYENIKNELKYNTNLKYIKEFIKHSVNEETGFITFMITTNSKDENQKIAQLIFNFISDQYETIKENVADHTVSIPNKLNSNEMINNDLLSYQQDFYLSTEKLARDIELSEKNLLYLEEIELIELNVLYILIQTIKGIIIGGVLGAVFTMVFIIAKVLNKIQDDEYLVDEYGLFVIGKKPEFNKKLNIIDKLSNKSLFNSEQDFYEYIISNINMLAGDAKKIHITGTIKKEDIESVYNNVKNKLNAEITFGRYVLENQKSLEDMHSADYVILVEKLFETSNAELYKEIKFMDQFNKEIKGVILF